MTPAKPPASPTPPPPADADGAPAAPPAKGHAAFVGERLLAHGALRDVLLAVKAHADSGAAEMALIFEDETGRQVDFDLRGSPEEVVERALPKAGPGRPKLGVVAREVTLLPRQWEWLEAQPAGASATLRRLVDEASKKAPQEQAARRAIDAASRVMTALAGDRRGYEEASRALFARDRAELERRMRGWPKDVRDHLTRLLHGALP